MQSRREQLRIDGDIPSPVRLKKLFSTPVVSKVEVMKAEDKEMGSRMEVLQEQYTSWTGQCQWHDQCHNENEIEKMHRAHKHSLCW